MRKSAWGWSLVFILIVGIAAIHILGNAHWDSMAQQYANNFAENTVASQEEEVDEEAEEERDMQEELFDVYDKVEREIDPEILVIGDSLAAGDVDEAHWSEQLSFTDSVVSVEGASVLDAWVNYYDADVNEEFDLVLVSAEQGGLSEALYGDLYEALVRDVIGSFEGAEVVALLHSGMLIQDEIIEHYGMRSVDLREVEVHHEVAEEIENQLVRGGGEERTLPVLAEEQLFSPDNYVEMNSVELNESLFGQVSGDLLAVQVEMSPGGGDVNVFAFGEMLAAIDANREVENQQVILIEENFVEARRLASMQIILIKLFKS